jgi:hypothetical protein
LTICSNGFVTLTASPGFATYLWSNGANTQSIIATSQGAYSVTGYTSAGCSKVSNSVNVTVAPAPIATITPSTTASLCTGDSVTLSAPAGYTYLWSNGATSQSILVLNSGTFSVSVGTPLGCTVQSSPMTIGFNPVPALSISANGPLTICPTGSVTLTASPGFASYLWNNGATTQSIISTAQGTYSVVGYTTAGCTAASSNVSVVGVSDPSLTIIATGPTSFCAGDSVQLSVNNTSGPISWSDGSTGSVI